MKSKAYCSFRGDFHFVTKESTSFQISEDIAALHMFWKIQFVFVNLTGLAIHYFFSCFWS